ncbi:NADH-quinone oxidoreductase subunit J [Fibrobacter sp.]|uniref:NADH-quinone oxidoreductase subunit J family protein n=1 Tax=Fibrobacter sp. TaxID=35828 RepID=UPI0025C2A26B|nr:NADH-quinone oxidoreductase subunit J [Fibrobacter sp.]MDD7498922.1 NADH-quinone oxidoreductase subunit J [Fibrobacter sp.]MDY5725003.1 NADH-quinone oxidoreductase subunit J [Fibrobacter sp.]
MIQNLLAGLIPQNVAFPMGGMDLAFYLVAFIILGTAVCTVAVKNILQSAVFLIFSFVATAILYLLLHAEFTALAQVMVYVGGVVIFMVFTILLTSRLGEDAFSVKIPRIFAAFALSIIFVLVMVKCLLPIEGLSNGVVAAPEGYASLKAFALRLLGYGEDGFVIPFEVVSILLLMTLICAITIARKGKEEEEK